MVQGIDGSTQRRRLALEGIAQHVDGRSTLGAGQLDAIDQLHIQSRRCAACAHPALGVS